jgi:three-Cys-motif partner protein
MCALNTPIDPVALPRDRLPRYDEHHKAKHRLLEEYMKVWLPKLAQTHPQVAIVDGFASAGRYRDDRIGSPLIFLQAYVTHAARQRFKAPPHFVFIESRRDFAQHLASELAAIDLRGIEVDLIHGQYQDEFPRVIDRLVTRYGRPPTFAFVDPLGYDNTPFALLRDYRANLGGRAEAMVYVPTDFMARFIGTTLTEQALDDLFGSREAWHRVRIEAAPGAEASAKLAEAYAQVLETQYELVSRFAVNPTSRNRYYLFFGTDSIDGLKAMKDAYWKVDPEDGRGYTQAIVEAAGQLGMFDAAVETPKEPEEDLLALMRAHFVDGEFSIEEAERFALIGTGFRAAHVRSLALTPALEAGDLEITERTARRQGGFTSGTRMRFVG